jgi:uncharacterized protein YutE (UPF0331/DUF86 family)
MELNRETIQGRLDLIDRNIQFLGEYAEMEEEQFLGSYKDIQAVKHSLLEIIEACLDIGSHIISIQGLQRPETYSDTFRILGTENFIGSELSEKLEKMAGFRNILIHDYLIVNDARILQYVKEDLGDIKEFVSCVMELV